MSLPESLKQSVEATKVDYRRLGKSGLKISVPVFGCMSFGDSKALPWAIDEEEVILHPYTQESQKPASFE